MKRLIILALAGVMAVLISACGEDASKPAAAGMEKTAPVAETPAAETPAVETPAAETPVTEAK